MSSGSKTIGRMLVLWPLRLLVGAVALGLIATMARIPIGDAPDHGLVRLNWRNVGERVRLCRDYTAAELQSLPQHMRRGQFCENSLLPYRLRVRIGDREVVDKVIRPAGARHDRPLFVAEELPLAPGLYDIELDYAPAVQPDNDAAESNADFSAEQAQAALEVALANAKHYRLETAIHVRAGHVVLVSLNEDARRLDISGN